MSHNFSSSNPMDIAAQLNRISMVSDGANEDSFQAEKTDTINYLNKQQEIRALVVGSQNFGHLAATVGLINRMASLSDDVLYSICLYYADNWQGETEIKIVIDALQVLLPQFKELNTEFKVISAQNTNRVRVIDIVRDIPSAIELGFTGGCDDGERSDLNDGIKAMQVDYFLKLQPYYWHLGADECMRLITNKEKTVSLDDYYEDEGINFHRLAYYKASAVLTDFDRQVIADSKYASKLEVALYLTQRTQAAQLNLCAVYGIETYTAPEVALYNISAGILETQSEGAGGAKQSLPCVVLLFQEITAAGWNIFTTLVSDPSSPALADEDRASATFLSWHKKRNVSANVSVLGGPDNYPDLGTVTAAVNQLHAGQVLVIYFGNVPQTLYDYLYSSSTYPTVFEGQATASTVFNFGKPFFKYSKGQEDVTTDYPTVDNIDNDGEAGADAQNSRRIASGLFTASPATWISRKVKKKQQHEIFPVSGISSINRQAFDDEDDGYFDEIGDYFHDEENDKFLYGMSALLTLKENDFVFTTDEALKLQAAAGNEKLLEFYKKIEGQSTVDLTAALGSGFCYDWFSKVSLKGTLTVNDAVAAINGDNTLVTLSGKTSSFLIPGLGVAFKFTESKEQLLAVMTMTFDAGSFSLPKVPWLQFPGTTTCEMNLDPTATVPAKGTFTVTVTAGVTTTMQLKIPSDPNTWSLQAQFGDNFPNLNDIFQFVGGINLREILPQQLGIVTDIRVSSLGFAYNYSTAAIRYISFRARTSDGTSWKLVPGVEISQLSFGMSVDRPIDMNNRVTIGNIGGVFGIGDGKLSINAGMPDIIIDGGLLPDSPPVSVQSILSAYLGDQYAAALPTAIKDTAIALLTFKLNSIAGVYSFAMKVTADWQIPLAGVNIFTITELGCDISAIVAQADNSGNAVTAKDTSVTGSFSGSIVILPDSDKITLVASAAYKGSDKGWTFTAKQTTGEVSLIRLFTAYLPADWKPDPSQFDITINGLGITIETVTNSWEFTGKTAKPIHIPGINLDITMNLLCGYKAAGTAVDAAALLLSSGVSDVVIPVLEVDNEGVLQVAGYYGALSATIKWENIELTVFYDFKPDYKAYGIRWWVLEGKIVEQGGKQIATLSFRESITLGAMVEKMISWATGSSYSLAAPWSILNAISLNNLSLEYNFTDKQVSFNVNIGPIEMGFARIDGISVTYKSNQPDPEDNGVIVELKGSFRWQDDKSKPLSWDAARPETTPAPEGQGNKYLDLRLLALGQHVTLPCFLTADTVQKAIECMKQLPVPDKNNITIPPVTLDANSSWLIGMDFGVLRFGGDDTDKKLSLEDAASKAGYLLTMQIIFNDPNLYALRIKLDGESAKVFKGLDFQIMYKKVSDTIGLYKAEITLPDKMRFIRMGQVNFTLPVFGMEYYTNGDFQVDVGFPWKEDFSRSFTFQTLIWTPVGIPIPVMGSLGVYFGKLSSATTSRVPAIDNGTFNPVLVFGFGIQFGLGYTFDIGILRAGFSLTIVAILEGILAKFNPYQLTDGSGRTDQLETSYYFWLKGTAGIIGKLFGTVDFAIIKADVNIDIRILASFTFAPYEPIELNLTASVSVSLSVKINLGLFKIKISFSFSAKISQTVTIKGIGGTSPWHVVPSGNAMVLAYRRGRVRALQLREASAITVNWNNLAAPAATIPLKGYMGLGLTMAGDNAGQLSEQLPCYVAMMFIDSVEGPQEDRTSARLKAFTDTPDTSFEALAKMILRWVAAALQSQPVTPGQADQVIIREDQLTQLLAVLNDPEGAGIFTNAQINAFMTNQFSMQVAGPDTDQQVTGAYFPLAPDVSLSMAAYGSSYPALSYTLGGYNNTSEDYRKFLREYFEQLAVYASQQTAADGRQFSLQDDSSESLGSFVFNDYFVMISRQLVQTALDALKEFKYFVQANDTPAQIVNTVNAGANLSGGAAYSVAELFADNSAAALTAGSKLSMQGASWIVQANDTFNSIAANTLFGGAFNGAALAARNAAMQHTLNTGITINYPDKTAYTTQPGESLDDVAAAIGVSTSDLIANGGVASLANLPLPVATLALPDFVYTTIEGDTLQSIAAKLHLAEELLAVPDSNSKVTNLFAGETLDIANLTQYKVGELIKEMQATQGLQHLSGMTSRYYMAGLRLPTDGISPLQKGMWVTGTSVNDYKLPPFAGLYALTGQQFPVPALNTTDTFNVTIGNGGLGWLTFTGADPANLTIAVAPGSDSANQITLVKAYATSNRLDTGMSFLGMNGMFNTKPATYSFSTQVDWSAASVFAMPYSGATTGTPGMQLWMLPDNLLQLPDPGTRMVNPRIIAKVGTYQEAVRGMVSRDLQNYGYASLVAFTIKKVPVVLTSPSTLTIYEVMGADGNSANILERIVSEVGNDVSMIQSLILAYQADATSTTTSGIQTDNAAALTMGLAQVNLSTETRPDMTMVSSRALQLDESTGMTLLNDKTTFIRLLWEAAITRSGGYFLYYFNSDNNGGLPDRIFNDKDEALVSLVVLYAKPAEQALQDTVTGYMNALVTTETFDPQKSTLFGEATPLENLTVPADATQTLSSLAYAYYGNVAEVAADNAGLQLRKGLTINVAEGVYEAGPAAPGGDLNAIASYFGTTAQAIQSSNPQQTSWPVKQFTSIYLPALTVSSNDYNTLGAIAKKYGLSLTALANQNKDLQGIFSDGQQIAISGGPVEIAATVPQGNITWEAVRQQPAAIPDKPEGADYGKVFLQNMYSLLSYQVYGNAFFNESKLGLPANPTTEPEDNNSLSKMNVPRTLETGDDWIFRVAVPYTRFVTASPGVATGLLPDPAQSPYSGLGNLLQVQFAWQDLYGNRLITDLSDPQAGDITPLNMPPVITGYSDALIPLNQWPSIAAVYSVDKYTTPQLNVSFRFDPTVYDGLIAVTAIDSITINALFTVTLDKDSANTAANYTIDQGVTVSAAVLQPDNRTVKLTVSQLPDNGEVTVNISNIYNTDKSLTFQGYAAFNQTEGLNKPSSSVIDKAAGDLITYTQVWYQLTDSYGVDFKVATTLVTESYQLSQAQVNSLVQEWIASVWQFVNSRAQGLTTVTTPIGQHDITFDIDITKLNQEEMWRLDTGFTIERSRGVVMGDLETAGNIRSVTTVLTPFAGAAGDTASALNSFVDNFEAALEQPGNYRLEVATGVDREAALSGAPGNQLWVVRTGLKKETAINYYINDQQPVSIFAPRPVSTQLQSRTGVPIWNFDPVKGISFDGQPDRTLDFSGIDMDQWAQYLFGVLDNVLTSSFVAPVQLVDQHMGTAYFQTMLDNKRALADIIREWMTFVFADESGQLADIQEAFKQQLLVRLTNAYTVKAGVQYTAVVNAGDFRLFFAGVDKTKPNLVNLVFTSDISPETASNAANYSISGGLNVTAVIADVNNPQIVTLQLSGNVVPDVTVVTIKSTFSSAGGSTIQPPLSMTAVYGAAATPELFGNISQNFRLLAAVPAKEDLQLLLYFSGVPDATVVTNTDKYQVSGLTVTKAVQDPDNQQIVILTVSGEPVAGTTTVGVTPPYYDASGVMLRPVSGLIVTATADVSHRTEGISLTSARVSLKNSDNVPLPFLVSAPQLVRNDDGAVLSWIDLDTSYEVSAIEHQIAYLPDIADYRASSWLNFADRPESLQTDLGPVKVPMILRAYPTPPSMDKQTGDYLVKADKSLSNILYWNYNINVSQTYHYPQDELNFTVLFNVTPDPAAKLFGLKDAFNELAEFVTVYPDVAKVFNDTLIKIDAKTTDQSVFDQSSTALRSFNEMIGRIITAAAGNNLKAFNMYASPWVTTVDPYVFKLTEGTGTVDVYTNILTVTLTGTPPAGIGIPTVLIPGYDTQVYGTPTADTFSYYFTANGIPLSAAVGQAIAPRVIQLPDLNLFARQNIQTSVEMKRNVDLVPGRQTADDFIYTTGETAFPDLFNPVLNYAAPVDIAAVSTGSDQKATLKAQLQSLFDVLLRYNSQELLSFMMTCSYNYQLNADMQGLGELQLPVVMQPLQTFNVDTKSVDTDYKTLVDMIDGWTGSIQTWFNEHKPDPMAGRLYFELSVFSNLDDNTPKPLLRLTGLYLDLLYISDVSTVFLKEGVL
ncbi:LysM peptidoglycan-binding domain-containing protein [Chitinophaga agri]|uniref:LysM peptidoglycan-binding domain-containing protein n=1 Tax=Chitinophaga agri TaxID=2703787 RepID=A0A6B9ZQ39_9BACT|nr:LysM peptidoglycan-binding domain-containing protein [Chitinophaga agri]QHS63654.1 LysM peptidoglycan-binding domain-containing protein [Chitinophaga agri]